MTPFWTTVARLGEAQILLPALLLVTLWLARLSTTPRAALWWLAPTAAAALVTTATKVAFIGWGIGYAPLDFTGVSGHAMFSAAIIPLLARAGCGSEAPGRLAAAGGAGYALAALIALSRWVTGHHSASEVLLGYGLGAAASGVAIAAATWPATRAPRLLVVGLLAWLLATPAGAPPSRTHNWVTALSLSLSGRSAPYTRQMMQREWQEQRQR